ncbi:hypothetical protein NIES2130_38930 [Scytonema sp. HK-05]|nr:hypothetical protein NIES2130_38930 [Scytonema sp. HK-05]
MPFGQASGASLRFGAYALHQVWPGRIERLPSLVEATDTFQGWDGQFLPEDALRQGSNCLSENLLSTHDCFAVR